MKHFTATLTINRRVRSRFGEGGELIWTTEPHTCRVDLAVDVDALMRVLGEKALGNKSKRAVECGGLVECSVHVKGATTTQCPNCGASGWDPHTGKCSNPRGCAP